MILVFLAPPSGFDVHALNINISLWNCLNERRLRPPYSSLTDERRTIHVVFGVNQSSQKLDILACRRCFRRLPFSLTVVFRPLPVQDALHIRFNQHWSTPQKQAALPEYQL